MRWENLTEESEHGRAADAALFGADAVTTRTFDMPEFRGITFHEVRARSVLNRVPGASRMPFEWTVNPYRGCTHACVYCFARKTHSYLDLDTGVGFDTQIVVKRERPRRAAPPARLAPLAGRPRGDGHERRLLPARRGPLPADAGHHLGAHRAREPVLDPHQGQPSSCATWSCWSGRRR